MENRAERTSSTRIGRFANRLAIIGVGAFLAFDGYQGERSYYDALAWLAEVHCREVIGSMPPIPGIVVTEETWQSCREVFLKEAAPRHQTDQVINYVAMGGGSLAVVYGLARFISGLPFLPRGRGRFNLS